MKLTLRQLEICLLGRAETPYNRDRDIAAVHTDSRFVDQDDVFFCLSGKRFDGHAFAAQAVDKGSMAVVAERPLPEITQIPVLIVRNTVAALGRLGRFIRDRTQAKVVCVTGTAGKTTVKELLAHIVRQRFSVATSYNNWNNQIGLPRSIFATSGEEDIWVLEAGISKPHDMEELGPIVAPDLVIILNIGSAHLDGLKNIQGVARAKASLLKYLQPKGTALISSDYPLLLEAAMALTPDVLTFSAKDAAAPFFCSFEGPEGYSSGRYLLRTPQSETHHVLPFCGTHFAENVAALAAAAHYLGLSEVETVKGLSSSSRPSQRFCCLTGSGWTLIDDSYNANPLSMTRAVQAARVMAGDQPLILVLGSMNELGPDANSAHEEMGRFLKTIAPTCILFQGSYAKDVARGYCQNGNFAPIITVDNAEATLIAWRRLTLSGGVILVKGSRSAKMELHVAALARELKCNNDRWADI